MTELLEAGFIDSFRELYPDKTGAYSWWSYQFNARANNAGWRIDYFILSGPGFFRSISSWATFRSPQRTTGLTLSSSHRYSRKFILSRRLRDRLAGADIFPEIMGSDHCPGGVTLDCCASICAQVSGGMSRMSERRSSFSRVGRDRSASHLLTAWRETSSCSASCSGRDGTAGGGPRCPHGPLRNLSRHPAHNAPPGLRFRDLIVQISVFIRDGVEEIDVGEGCAPFAGAGVGLAKPMRTSSSRRRSSGTEKRTGPRQRRNRRRRTPRSSRACLMRVP